MGKIGHMQDAKFIMLHLLGRLLHFPDCYSPEARQRLYNSLQIATSQSIAEIRTRTDAMAFGSNFIIAINQALNYELYSMEFGRITIRGLPVSFTEDETHETVASWQVESAILVILGQKIIDELFNPTHTQRIPA